MKKNILFTDIVGYSKLTGKDQSLALELLNEHDEIIEPIINRNNGKIIKRIGDAIVAIFDDSKGIIQTSVEIQQSLKNRNNRNQKSRKINIRVGLHYGNIKINDEEIYGLGYDLASEIEPIAEFGGIALSKDLYSQVSINEELMIRGLNNIFFVRPIAKFKFKSNKTPILVYKLYLNILDWYDEPYNDTATYLLDQHVDRNIFEVTNDFNLTNSNETYHLDESQKYLKENELSYAIYHYKMFYDLSQHTNKEFLIQLFSECGLHRLVDKEIKEIKNESSKILLSKGINYFNKKEFDLSEKTLYKSLENMDSESLSFEVFYYIFLIHHLNGNYDKISEIYNSYIDIIRSNEKHHLNLKIFNTIAKCKPFSKEAIVSLTSDFISQRNKNYKNMIDKKYNLFVYKTLMDLNNKYVSIDKATELQNTAIEILHDLKNAISGFLLKQIYHKNPLIHKMITEPLEFEFIDDEGLDDYDLDDIITEKKEVTIFCTSCGAKNSIKFKFCTSCGTGLIKI